MCRKCYFMQILGQRRRIENPRIRASKKKDGDEFDSLYIDAQTLAAHDPVLASAVLLIMKSLCPMRWEIYIGQAIGVGGEQFSMAPELKVGIGPLSRISCTNLEVILRPE